MADMQGNGKVRLIAKKGRYMEDASAIRLQQLVLDGRTNGLTETQAATLKEAAGAGLSNYFIEFDVTPDITESGSATYSDISDIRAAASIMLYKGSPSRTFTIGAKLVARNAQEAAKVQAQIHILKSWRMPESYTGGFNAGTPTLLYLQGYGKMFKDIPTVMTDLSIEFSSEFDAISAGSSAIGFNESSSRVVTEQHNELRGGHGAERIDTVTTQRTVTTEWIRPETLNSFVPIIVPVSITLREAHSSDSNLEGLKHFDILRYRTGTLPNW